MRTEVMFMILKDIIDSYKIPELQRLVDNEHIISMVEDQKKEYNKYNTFSMLQSFTIACITNEDKGYILDGQHRVAAYSQLKNDGYDVDNIRVPVVKYNLDNINEVKQYYNRINIHSPIEPILNLENIEKNILQFLYNRFTRNYFKTGDEENNCKTPHISVNYLKKYINALDITNKLNLHNKKESDLYKYILDVNDYLEIISSYQLDKTYTNRFEKCKNKKIEKSCKYVCYLGIFRKCEWLDIALYSLFKNLIIDDFGDIIKKIILTDKRIKIPKNTKKEVWKKYNSEDAMKGKCCVCDNILEYDNMECSHIVAHVLGGDSTINNLLPCCKTCNRDMGIMNLYEYKKLLLNYKN
jgi:hypothetical protein